jgi:hypothetical protein
MSDLVINLIGKGVLLPLALSFILVGAIRVLLGRPNGPLLAAAAIAAAIGITYAVLFGWPTFPPHASSQKVAYLVLFGLAAGLVLDLRGHSRAMNWLAAIVWPGVIIIWLAWRQLSAPSAETLITLGILWLVGLFQFAVLFRERGPNPASAVIVLFAAIGGAFIALFGASGSVGQFYGIVAAAIGGFLLWNWPVPRFQFGGLGTIGAGGAFFTLAVQTVLFTSASKLALATLLLVFLAPFAAKKLPFAGRPALGTISLGIAAAIPALIAAIIAFIITGDSFESPI